MTAVKADGTAAKDIASYFIDLTTDGRVTSKVWSRTITNAKYLLSCGYTKDEIINVIDYLLNIKHVNMFSLGYLNSCIGNVLKEIQKLEEKEKLQQIKKELTSSNVFQQIEVIDDNESKERNRDKLSRLGVQPRFGEELTFDLFEGQ